MDRLTFHKWASNLPEADWQRLPLTHVTKAFTGEKILESGIVLASTCKVRNGPHAYFFYGRPAYRASADNLIQLSAAAPYCLIFKPDLIERSAEIVAFDSGAFANRMYSHVLIDEMSYGDFSLGKDSWLPNKVIQATYGTREAYYQGDKSNLLSAESEIAPWALTATAYLSLLKSQGRNEPDDRVGTIEVVFDHDVICKDYLLAVVVPNIHWGIDVRDRSPLLTNLDKSGVKIFPYVFIPGKHSEYYQSQIEAVVATYYRSNGYFG
jgi:hypothetical protein